MMQSLHQPRLITLAVALLLAASSFAQDASLKRADGYFDSQDYHTAAKMFEQVIDKNPQSGIATFKAGVCYLYTSQQERGLSYIKKAATLPLERDLYYDFWLGRAYHLNMKLDSAIMGYRAYLKKAPANDEFKKGTENLIAQIHRTETYFISTENSPFEASNLGENINSPYTERSPMVTRDGRLMVFTTRRPIYPDEPTGPDGEYADKIFMVTLAADGSWGKAVPVLQPEDRQSWYRPIQFMDNETKLLLHRPGKEGGLYLSERSGDGWKIPYKLNEKVKASHLDLDVTFTQDMKRMVYAKASMNDDYTDLFIVDKDSRGLWGSPRKLNVACSTDDDLSPVFLEGGNTIVFSSKGHNGLGGFDLFKTSYDLSTKKWSAPANLGYPINGPGNDISYTEIDGAPKVSYIASARAKGFGEADIYKITYTLPTSQDPNPPTLQKQ